MDQAKKKVKTEGKSPCNILPLYLLTSNSSILVWHFSKLILFIATRSCLGLQSAAWTTAVAPLPEREQERNSQRSTQIHRWVKPVTSMRSTYWQRTSKLLFILFQCFLHMHTFPLARHPSHISDGKEKPESFFSIHHKKLQTKWFQIIYQDITTTSMHFVVHYTSLDTSVFINNMTCTVDTWRGGYYALSIGGFFVVLLGQSLFNQVFCSPIQWTGKKNQ